LHSNTTRSQAFAFPVAPGATPSRPAGLVVLALCIGQVLLWGCAFALTYKAPEIDSAEQFVWAFSLENGYWKHPPMPSWIMHALLQVFGPSVALPFVATQASIAIALALTWRLGCEFMSPQRSLIAMALTSLVAYHNVGADCFNHNTALLPFQAATVLLFFLATRRGVLHLWALTGLFAGLSMLVKYVALMPIAGLLVYVLLDRRLHQRRTLVGLAVAAGVFLLVLLPHALWLETTNFLPFRYAHSVARPMPGLIPGLHSLADFGLIQALRLLPMLLGLAYVLATRHGRAVEGTKPALLARDRLFLWSAALAPLALTVAFAVLSRTELQSRWGANAFLLSGLLAMSLVSRIDTAPMLRRTLHFVVAAHVVLSIGMTLTKTIVAEHFHWRTRANFPGATLAHEAMSVWKAHTDAPLRIVVSDIWLGGNIIANSPQRVAVLIDGRMFKSPWVDEKAVRDCGALVLDDQTSGSTGMPDNSPALNELMARASITGTWNLPWAVSQQQATDRATGLVRWGVIEPRDPGACRIR
jgi:4-amino-4-deoxy-L-arabinose transferase-like glycosyltransferase